MRRLVLLAGAVAAAVAGGPGPAAAFVCSDPTTYLVVCCPRPCMVFDVGRLAAQQGETAQEVVRLGQMFAHTAQLLQQVEGLEQALFNVGHAGVNGLNRATGYFDASYGPRLPSLSASALDGQMQAIYAPDFGTAGPTSYGPASYLAMRGDLSRSRVGALAYSMNVRQIESGADPRGQPDIRALGFFIAAARDRRQDITARGYVLLRILQEVQIREELIGRITEIRAKAAAELAQPDMTPDMTAR